MLATDKPTTEEVKIDWDEAKTNALLRSVELRRQRAAVKQAELQLVARKNSLQPQLDVSQLYQWYEGEVGNGLEFQLPIRSRFEASSVRNALLKVTREKAKLEAMELDAVHVLNAASRDLDFQYQAAKTNLNRAATAEDEVTSITSLFKGGKTTLDLVLDAQRRLAQSRTDYTSAIAEYATAIVTVHVQTGELLAEHNITIEKPEKSETPAAEAEYPASDSASIPGPNVELKAGDRLTVGTALFADGKARHETIQTQPATTVSRTRASIHRGDLAPKVPR